MNIINIITIILPHHIITLHYMIILISLKILLICVGEKYVLLIPLLFYPNHYIVENLTAVCKIWKFQELPDCWKICFSSSVTYLSSKHLLFSICFLFFATPNSNGTYILSYSLCCHSHYLVNFRKKLSSPCPFKLILIFYSPYFTWTAWEIRVEELWSINITFRNQMLCY